MGWERTACNEEENRSRLSSITDQQALRSANRYGGNVIRYSFVSSRPWSAVSCEQVTSTVPRTWRLVLEPVIGR